MNVQQRTQEQQDRQAVERANGPRSTGAPLMTRLRQLGRVGTLAVGLGGVALVALIGILVAPTQDAAQARTAAARIDYAAGIGLYDNGWAGGPGRVDTLRKAPAVARVPYEAGWMLYDQGYAGGPAPAGYTLAATELETRPATGLTQVPYHAGWTLYDDGWAGGPQTNR